ncbi:hypothetical protein [Rhizobium laguerreae]|uniref:hypothetical protein n=1 Tax=Rhizobium laguerreae TaxID=1076926 RepID=UPI001C924CE3|nr:hypothetical protein [Rhizobium laguerreae]MBY3556445.1 hypothetical protein [Rhizobium laguerreae]
MSLKEVMSAKDDFPFPLVQVVRSATTFDRLSALMKESGLELGEGEIWGLHYTPKDFDNALKAHSHFTPLISDDPIERGKWTGYQVDARNIHVLKLNARNAQRNSGEFRANWHEDRQIWDIRCGSRSIPSSRYVKIAFEALHPKD